MSENTLNNILELFYILIGLQLLYTAYRVLKASSHQKKYGTALFWILLATTFIIGPYIPNVINGIFILVMGGLTLFKQVIIKNIIDITENWKIQFAANNRSGSITIYPLMYHKPIVSTIKKTDKTNNACMRKATLYTRLTPSAPFLPISKL